MLYRYLLGVVVRVCERGVRRWETVGVNLAVNGRRRFNGPIVAVPVGSARTIQLYYALSPDEQHARQLPGFATRWQVETAHGTLQGETRFHRVKVDGVTMPCGAHASEYCLSGYAS